MTPVLILVTVYGLWYGLYRVLTSHIVTEEHIEALYELRMKEETQKMFVDDSGNLVALDEWEIRLAD